MRTGALFVGGLVLCLVAGLQACGSDDSGSSEGTASTASGGPKPCNEDPWICPDGQTCWIADNGADFKCLNSGQGQIGDTCKNIVDQPSCADDLLCFNVEIPGKVIPPVCTPYCDPTVPAHACPDGGNCVSIQSKNNGLMFFACMPPEGTGGAGGMGGSGGAGGAGGAGNAGGAGGAGNAGGAGGAGNAGGAGGAGGN